MSWFSIADYAKNALSEAQKKIDKALDIQAKEDNKDAQSGHTEVKTKLSNVQNNTGTTGKLPNSAQIRNEPLSAKNKVVVSKPKTLTRKISNDISDDFFSILEDDNLTSNSRKVKPYVGKNVIAKVSSTSNNSKLDAKSSDEEQYQSNSTDAVTKIKSSIEEDSTQEKKFNFNQAESTYSDVTLVAGSDSAEDTVDNLGDFNDLTSDNAQQLTSASIDVSKNTENLTPDVCDDESIKSPPIVDNSCETGILSQEVQNDRTISPSVSTAASSEFDILDQESVTSELSSKYNDGLIILQSSFNIHNVDAIDSDASQALSPVHDPKDVDNLYPVSSNEDAQSLAESILPHLFQPLHHPDERKASDEEQTDATLDDVLNDCQIETESQHAENIHTDPSPTRDTNSVEIIEEPTSDERYTDKYIALSEKMEMDEQPTSDERSNDKYIALSEKMKVYEQQLMTLSYKNAQLNEENDNLRTDISRTQDQCEKNTSKDLERMADSVKACENSNRLLKDEKANLMKQMAVLKSQLASRMTNDQVQNTIGEKEKSIQGLMEEGEILAKKHLQQNNLIKKLKSQGQERESELKTLKEKTTNFETGNTKLKEELREARGQGREERETSLRISDAYEQRERETQILHDKLTQSEEKQRTFQVNLDAAYKEIGDFHKQVAEYESKSVADWKSKEDDLKRESEIEKKKIASEQEHQRQLLILQIMELNNSVARVEAANARKDDDHRREIRELQQRIQDSEGRNQDLSDNVASATRPLLRQMENLQASHSSQQRSWNALEKTLNSRIGEAQAELLIARENERVAQSNEIEAKSKALAYEKHIEKDKKIISQQKSEMESLGKQIEKYKEQTLLLTEELEELKTTHKETVHKSRKERLFLENQLQMEKVRSEADRKKSAAQQETLQKERDRMMWSRSEVTSVSSNQIVETESVGSSNDAFHSADAFDKQWSSSLPGLVSQRSFDAGKSLSVSNVLENLQTQLKLRDGEIAQLRGDINMLDRTRSSMAEEIVRLTNLNEDLENVSEELKTMKIKLMEVEGRYSAILTMYGEKEEENEELRMDLVDVKSMYRQQINDLLKADPHPS